MKQAVSSSPSYKWWVFAVVALGTFVTVMDQGSVQVALPEIATHFKADLPTVQWVVVGYALAISVLLLPMGGLGDMVNRKAVYISGLVIFVIGVGLSGFAQNIVMLIASKVLQGVGSALIQGNMIAILLSVFPGSERGKVLGLNLAVVGVGAVVGPAFGGVLVNAFGWRSVFFVSALIATLAVLANTIVLDKALLSPARAGKKAFDWLGGVLSGSMLLLFLLAMSNGYRMGWTSPTILIETAAAVVLLGLFIWWELRSAAPMLDLRLFQRRPVLFGVWAGWSNFMASGALIFLMPFYLQKVAGYSPREAGLIMVPGAIALAVAGAISGPLSDRFGWRIFTIGGLAVSALSLLIFSFTIEIDSSLALIIPLLILSLAGNGVFNSPNNSSILAAVDRAQYGVVSALTQLVRNGANIVSIAIATTIVASTMASHGYPPSLDAVGSVGGAGVQQAFLAGMQRAFLVLGLLVAGGIIAASLRNKQAAAPTAKPSPPTAPAADKASR